jgi:hypothetical protein
MTTALVKLAHQIQVRGGQEDDIRLLEKDEVILNVAEVLARAGNLTRGYDILVSDGSGRYAWRRLSIVRLDIKSITEAARAVSSIGFRLAGKHELLDFMARHSEFNFCGKKIIGEMCGESADDLWRNHWAISGKVIRELPIKITEDIFLNNVYYLAVIFN